MKIQCSTCSARYSVADEKVAGRQFKVRCKKCGDTMVVHGVEAVWHVSIDGAQEGPFTVDELGPHVGENADAFVWREGLEDWVAAREVAALALLFREKEESVEKQITTDLFAPSEGELFAGHDESAAPSTPASSLTGARNESSVLFSLSNLSALSNEARPEPTAPRSKSASAPTEGSGLIDIRALASTIGALAPPPSEEVVDELLGFGGNDLASPLGAPVVMPERESSTSKRPIMIGSVFAAVVAIAAGIVVAVVQLDDGPPLAQNDHSLVDEPALEAGPIAPGAIAHQPSAPSQPSAVATPEPQPEPRPEPGAIPEPTPQADGPRARDRRPRPPRVDRTPVRPERVPPPATDDDDPIGDILGPRRPVTTEPSAPSLPPTPNRGDVTSAMSAISSTVRACGNGNHGMALVNASFGSNGSVRTVDVSGTLPGPVRSCVARAVRSAHLPEFSRSSFRVNYPFRL